MIKKILVTTLIGVSLIHGLQSGFAEEGDTRFIDLEKHWAKDRVEKLVSRGIINGYEDGTFKPDNQISVAEFLKLLMVNNNIALGEKGDAWYEEYVNGASGISIIKEGEFSDYNTPINRGQMALMISRSLKLTELSSNKFDDEENFSKYKDEIYKVAHIGIINGYEDNTFRALDPATRAEASVMISRIDEYLKSNNAEVVEEEKSNSALDAIWTEEEFVEFMNEVIVTTEKVEFFEGIFTTIETVETPNSDHAGFSLDENNQIRYNDIGPNVHDYDFENYEESKWIKPLAHDLLKGLTYYAEKNGHYVDLDTNNDYRGEYFQIRYLAHPSDKIGGGGSFIINLWKTNNTTNSFVNPYDMDILILDLSPQNNVDKPYMNNKEWIKKIETDNHTFNEYLGPLKYTFERIFGREEGLKFYNYALKEYRIKHSDESRMTYRKENFFFDIGKYLIEQDDSVDGVSKSFKYTIYFLDYYK